MQSNIKSHIQNKTVLKILSHSKFLPLCYSLVGLIRIKVCLHFLTVVN